MMILKGSQRGGPRQLAAHLLNLADNDHILVQEVQGFVSRDLDGAMIEAAAVARGTRCTQPVFSLSLNPPKDANASLADLMAAIERAEAALGLDGQPRAVVIHEKEGRRHAHAVWSRINPEEMKAINLPFFKTRLSELSKELYLEHDWELPQGYRTEGWKNPLNFTLAEWQQAKRNGMDPREIKQVFREAWERSDGLASFKNALEQRGYYLARGDRRGVVATDIKGEVYSVARWTGLKTRELNARIGKGETLPALKDVRSDLDKRVTKQLRDFIVEDRKAKQEELKPYRDKLKAIVARQRNERERLTQTQAQRWKTEAAHRAGRFRRGLGIVLDVLSGHLFKQRKKNEEEAYAAFVRDRTQRERLFDDQALEREPLQKRIDAIRRRHREERRAFAARISAVLRQAREPQQHRPRARDHELGL
jgi:hypothetical protein